MIRDTLERRRLDTKAFAEPFNDNEEVERRLRAAVGSERLRHAILETMGIDPGPFILPSLPPRRLGPLTLTEPHSPVANIQRVACRHFEIPLPEMWSQRRSRGVARPRQVAMYLSRELTSLSLPAIGRRFGKRDHTTVLHAIRKIETLIASDPDLALKVNEIRAELEPA